MQRDIYIYIYSVTEGDLHAVIIFKTHVASMHRRQGLKGGISTERRGATFLLICTWKKIYCFLDPCLARYFFLLQMLPPASYNFSKNKLGGMEILV